MPKLSDDPAHWRKLANEARSQAEEFTEPWRRRIMLRIARDYERLAEEAEARSAERDKPR